MLAEYHYDDVAEAKVPCCPRFPTSHHLSAEPGGYYCYECAEHYADPLKARPVEVKHGL